MARIAAAATRTVAVVSKSQPSVERRIRAAMALAGISSVRELARLIDHAGLGERTLRKLMDEADPRVAERRDLLAIAEATGLPSDFFTRDLFATDDDLAARVAELERLVRGDP